MIDLSKTNISPILDSRPYSLVVLMRSW